MAQRVIKIYGELDDDGGWRPPDRDEVRQCLEDLEGSVYRLGGSFIVSVDRQEVAPDEFETVGYVIRYDSFAPAKRAPKASEPTVEDVPEPDAPEGVEEGATSV